VLANRLSENPKWNVLLIEAGDVETPLQSVPIMAPYTIFSKYNWGYSSEPQSKACLGKIFAPFHCHSSSSYVNIYDQRQGDETTDAQPHAAKLWVDRA
jgi:GMC oxidoreductase